MYFAPREIINRPTQSLNSGSGKTEAQIAQFFRRHNLTLIVGLATTAAACRLSTVDKYTLLCFALPTVVGGVILVYRRISKNRSETRAWQERKNIHILSQQEQPADSTSGHQATTQITGSEQSVNAEPHKALNLQRAGFLDEALKRLYKAMSEEKDEKYLEFLKGEYAANLVEYKEKSGVEWRPPSEITKPTQATQRRNRLQEYVDAQEQRRRGGN